MDKCYCMLNIRFSIFDTGLSGMRAIHREIVNYEASLHCRYYTFFDHHASRRTSSVEAIDHDGRGLNHRRYNRVQEFRLHRCAKQWCLPLYRQWR